MSNITQFFPGGSSGGINGGGFNRREVYVGPLTTTWTAGAPGNVEVACWGGGGSGPSSFVCGGGGGGGYVRYIYSVVASDQLSITVGGTGGTSSISCPTQTPTSPISATGGSNGIIPNPSSIPFGLTGIGTGGAGGTGSGTVPASRSGYLWTRTGGQGAPSIQYPANNTYIGGGGGSAGSEFGNGIAANSVSEPYSGGATNANGAGIGGAGIGTLGGSGNVQSIFGAPSSLEYTPWFYSYEVIGGNGGNAGGIATPTQPLGQGGNGGFLAGGGAGLRIGGASLPPTAPLAFNGGNGGIAGGAGGHGQAPAPTASTTGGVGLVILYYNI
jgi:hypothetical protein